ncbi:MAG: VCBS repeat-containing protein [Bdellovibrionales bacterium]|nr:VCBS repeat-containing protein [Bdellovibrionales bacterium]
MAVLSLNNNLSSLRAQSNLSTTSRSLSTVFERLSSGQRINKASDDAAGLALAESLKSKSTVYGQAIRNVNDGISTVSIASAALGELESIVTRQKEIAAQAANGVFTLSQRVPLQQELDALTAEFNRILGSTKFNGEYLLTGESSSLSIQAGADSNGRITAKLREELSQLIGDGTFSDSGLTIGASSPDQVATGDFNHDGIIDLVYQADDVYITFGQGDGTFSGTISLDLGGESPVDIKVADLNGDGYDDLGVSIFSNPLVKVLINDQMGGFTVNDVGSETAGLSLAFADINNDGNLDIFTTSVFDSTAYIYEGDGTGSFSSLGSFFVGEQIGEFKSGDFNGDGNADFIGVNTTDSLYLFLGDGSGGFTQSTPKSDGTKIYEAEVADFNRDGYDDLVVADNGDLLVLFSNGDGTFTEAFSQSFGPFNPELAIGDINGDGLTDIVMSGDGSVYKFTSDVDGNFTYIGKTTSVVKYNELQDLNGDGVLDGIGTDVSKTFVGAEYGGTTTSTSEKYYSVLTQEDAQSTLESLEDDSDRIALEQGKIGAFEARLESAVSSLGSLVQETKAAESRIRDVDVAEEAAQLVALQVRQQAATAVLGQANLQPELILELLKL